MVERVGSPSAAAFETALNAALATVLSSLIGSFEILVTDKLPSSTRLLKGLIDSDTTGATVITNPYQVKVFEGYDDATVAGMVEAFIVANPAYWLSPVQYRYSDQLPGIQNRSILFLLYNVSAADGAANWAPGYIVGGGGGGPPTGAASGDLSGTYPTSPLVGPTTTGETQFTALAVGSNIIGTRPVASNGDVEWEIELQKAATQYNTTIRANLGDGTTPDWSEYGITISPGIGGTFDCPLTVTISGGNMRLIATPATTGWNARVRARTFTPAP